MSLSYRGSKVLAGVLDCHTDARFVVSLLFHNILEF